jgi:protocatechuate 3,4-dioxygenase beta subunit
MEVRGLVAGFQMKLPKCVFAIGLLALPLSRLPAQISGAVDGRVTDSVTHLGIGGVKVEAMAAEGNGQTVYSATTDPGGAFHVANLGPGKYTARFQRDGFGDPQSDDDAERPFAISGPGETARVSVELTPLSTLRGRLLDSDGQPMPGIRMQLLRLHYLGLYATDTDGDGRFAFENVRPTAYTILAKPADSHDVHTPPPARDGEPMLWVATYYPGVIDRSLAAPIVIPAGAELAGYEFRLAASPAFRVRGTVVDETGAPMARARVELKAAGEPGNEATAVTGRDGRFEFPGVVAGWWGCTAETGGPPDSNGGPSVVLAGWVTKQRGVATLGVGHRDVDGLEIRVSPPFGVGLSVERESGGSSSPDPAVGSIFLNALDGVGEMLGARGEAPGGQRRFEQVFAGRYKVSMGDAEPGYYLAAAMLGDRDILGQEFELAPGSPEIRAVFRPLPGGVNGTVDGSERATVVLLPQDEALRDLDAISKTQRRADGRFEIDSLRPGGYYAWAFERLDVDALRDAAFVRTLVARAASVNVSRGETASLALSVTPWPE